MQGIREGVLVAELSNLGKPGVFDAVMENINPVLVEDITRTQECNHVEKGELMLVDHCRGREGARQEMECWGRSAGVETLEPLEGLSPVDGQYSHIRRGEQEGGKTTE